MKLETETETDLVDSNQIFLPKSDLFEVEGILDDTRSGDAHPEDILLRRQVIGFCYSVYISKVTEMEHYKVLLILLCTVQGKSYILWY